MNVGKETDRKWEEGDEIRALEFKNAEYGRLTRVVASEEVKNDIRKIGMSCLSWKWRKRSSVKITERTYEERAQALHC